MPKPFPALAYDLMVQQGISHDEAYGRAKSLYPTAYSDYQRECASAAQRLNRQTTMTPHLRALANERAQQAFQDPRRQAAFVKLNNATAEIFKATGKPWVECYAMAKAKNAALCNEAGIDASAEAPTISPQQCAMLGLSASANAQEFEVAFQGNGGQLSPLNPNAVFEALVSHYISTQRNWTRGYAIAHIKENHPALARLLGLLT